MKPGPRISFASYVRSSVLLYLTTRYWNHTQEILDALRDLDIDGADITTEIVDAITVSLGVHR